jgi:peptide/nickel transport system substrate-binding protein
MVDEKGVGRMRGGKAPVYSALAMLLALGMVFAFTVAAPALAKELRVGLQSFDDGTPGLDSYHTTNAQTQMQNSIHECLIEREPYSQPLKFLPALAVSWKMVSPTVMEVKLRKGVKFHDGSTMEAEDVAFSLNRIWQRTRPQYDGAQGRFFYNFDRVEIVDPLTVRIHTKRPEPLIEVLLSDKCAGIVSKKHHDKVGFEKADLSPVGAGPYRVVSFKARHQLVLERFSDYWGEKPPLDKITFIHIPEISSRITALINGEVDFIGNIPPDQEGPLQKRKDVKLVGVVWPMFHVYAINMTNPVTGNKKLRQAMNLAVDRELLVKGLWQGKALVPKAHQFKEYGPPMYMPELVTVKYDPERAKQLVKESGYKGEPVILTFLPHYYTYGSLAAQAIAEMWQKVGISVQLKSIDSYPTDMKDIMIRIWSNPMYYPDPMGAYDTHWSKAGWPYRRGMFKPESPKWDALYEKARFSTDVKERRQAYTELLQIAQDESGYILLYQPYESFAMRSDIEWKIPTNMRPYALTFRAGQIKVGK